MPGQAGLLGPRGELKRAEKIKFSAFSWNLTSISLSSRPNLFKYFLCYQRVDCGCCTSYSVACKLISDTRNENCEIARIVMVIQQRVAKWMKSTVWHVLLQGSLSLISKNFHHVTLKTVPMKYP
jgi:hypothetical protein